MQIPKALAIDYGTVRVGLAVSMASLADPLKIIPNDEKLISKILDICKENYVEIIVVGLSENVMAEKTKDFVKLLQEKTDLPIEFTDETLSSHNVHKKLQTAKKSKRGADIDHYAAAEFLQVWLDEYPS
jgi:putative transcription antitermination factor YqgF